MCWVWQKKYRVTVGPSCMERLVCDFGDEYWVLSSNHGALNIVKGNKTWQQVVLNTAPTFLDTSIIIHYVHSSTFLIHRAKVRRMEMAHKFFEIYRATVYRRTSPSIQPKLKQRNVSDKPKCNEKRAQWLYIYIYISISYRRQYASSMQPLIVSAYVASKLAQPT